jgi:MMP 1-O-methyltransferase
MSVRRADDDKAAVRREVRGIDGWLSDREGDLLYDLAHGCTGRGVIVEIGSWKGRSTIWLARGSRAGRRVRVCAVDPHTGSAEHQRPGLYVSTLDEFRRNVAAAGVDDIVVPVVATSEEAARIMTGPVELVFIDGAHEYEAAKLDVLTWLPRLVDGGIMALHDTIGWDGPRRVAEEFLFRANTFRRVRLVDSITFAQKTTRVTVADRLRSRFLLAVKRLVETTRLLPVPKPLRTFGKRIVRSVQ